MGGSWFVPAEEIDGLLDRLGDVENRDVLELGCGDGKLMERVLLRGGRVIGVDVSQVAREMTAKRLKPFNDLAWLVLGDPMENLSLPDGCMDYVISYGSLEHSLDIAQAVQEMGRVLKFGGRWLNYAPNNEWIHEDQPLETTMDPNEWQPLYDAARLKVEGIIKNGDNTIYWGTK